MFYGVARLVDRRVYRRFAPFAQGGKPSGRLAGQISALREKAALGGYGSDVRILPLRVQKLRLPGVFLHQDTFLR